MISPHQIALKFVGVDAGRYCYGCVAFDDLHETCHETNDCTHILIQKDTTEGLFYLEFTCSKYKSNREFAMNIQLPLDLQVIFILQSPLEKDAKIRLLLEHPDGVER